MWYLYLDIFIPLAFIALSLIFFAIDLIKRGKINFTINTKKGTLNCLSLAAAICLMPFLFTGVHNLHEETIRETEIAKKTKDTSHKTSLISFVKHVEVPTLKVTSNLSPELNKLLANKLKKMFPHSKTTSVNLSFSYPIVGFKHDYAGGTLQDYDPGAQIQVDSECGSFPIDNDYIGLFGKNRPSDVTRHLQSEQLRIVKENLNQICHKLEPCML